VGATATLRMMPVTATMPPTSTATPAASTTLAASAQLQRVELARERPGQAGLVSDPGQQRAARVRHQALCVRRDIYLHPAPSARHLKGDPPELDLCPSASRRIPAQADSQGFRSFRDGAPREAFVPKFCPRTGRAVRAVDSGGGPSIRACATESVLTGREAHPEHLVPAAIPFRNDPTWAIRAPACGP
jgi:hypothetical protein